MNAMLFLELGMSENDSTYATVAGGWPAAALLGADQLYLGSGDTQTGINTSHLHDIMMHSIPDDASNVCPVQ